MGKPKTKKNKHLFEVNDIVKYIGTLFDMYTNESAIVLSRSTSKGSKYYKIKFIKDDREMTFKENLLVVEEENEN